MFLTLKNFDISAAVKASTVAVVLSNFDKTEN